MKNKNLVFVIVHKNNAPCNFSKVLSMNPNKKVTSKQLWAKELNKNIEHNAIFFKKTNCARAKGTLYWLKQNKVKDKDESYKNIFKPISMFIIFWKSALQSSKNLRLLFITFILLWIWFCIVIIVIIDFYLAYCASFCHGF